MQALLERLEKAKFSGTLELHFDHGQIVSAELRHWLVKAEFEKPIPIVETRPITATQE